MLAPVNEMACFATPIFESRLPDCDALNQELRSLFLTQEAKGDEFRNLELVPTTRINIFESKWTLFNWKEPCIQRLRQFCVQQLGQVIVQTNGYAPEQVAKFQVQMDTWYHITRFGGYIGMHNHPMASWSGVYCVDHGEDLEEHPDSGVTKFFDPRGGSQVYLDPGNAQLVSPWTTGSTNFKLRAGQLVMFPSYLMHEVSPYFGRNRERITVAFNAMVGYPNPQASAPQS